MMDDSSLLLLLVSVNDIISLVGPFLFFLGNKALTTFDAFRFRVAMTFVEHFVDPSDLREAAMMLLLYLFIFHACVVILETPLLYSCGVGQCSDVIGTLALIN